MSPIELIGSGHFATPMVRFLSARNRAVTVSERNAQTAAELAASHKVTVAFNQDVVEAIDIVFPALGSHCAMNDLAPLQFCAGQKIVLVMAGETLAQLCDLCAPVSEFSMTYPSGYLEHGRCPLLHEETNFLSAE
ncbi:MAG: NAD(P)-binding domain-containing protein [Roseobacter sp.]